MAPRTLCSLPLCELEEVLERSVTHYAHRLRQRLNLSADDLADVRQELTLAAWSALPGYDATRASVQTYLDRVLRTTAVNLLREILRERLQRCPVNELARFDVDAVRLSDIRGAFLGMDAGPFGMPHDSATDAIDTHERFLALLPLLPTAYRVLLRGLLAGRSTHEIADSLGVSESLIRHRIRRLLALLRGEDSATDDDVTAPLTRR